MLLRRMQVILRSLGLVFDHAFQSIRSKGGVLSHHPDEYSMTAENAMFTDPFLYNASSYVGD